MSIIGQVFLINSVKVESRQTLLIHRKQQANTSSLMVLIKPLAEQRLPLAQAEQAFSVNRTACKRKQNINVSLM